MENQISHRKELNFSPLTHILSQKMQRRGYYYCCICPTLHKAVWMQK